MIAVALTLIIALCVAVTTESVRGYLLFGWQIDEGEQFVFEISVEGYSKTGSFITPVAQMLLNNSRIQVEIVSLPANAIILDGQTFAQHVIEHLKTSTRFENGTSIPAGLYFELNNLASRSFFPRGPWNYLDEFYPDQFAQPMNETAESYISYLLDDVFYVGHIAYGEGQASGWHCLCSKDTGIPSEMTTWAWSIGGLHEYSYNVTLSILA
jgi:hypothetical protein